MAWVMRCERRVWLDGRSAQPPQTAPTADARARMTLRANHKCHILAAIEGVEDFSELPWNERVTQTRLAMQRGAAMISGAALEAPIGGRLLHGAPDLLQRQTTAASGAWIYEPIAIVLHTRPTRWERLLLDSWRWLVRQTQGWDHDPPGELWLGANGYRPVCIKRQTASLAAFTAQIRRAIAIAAGEAPPIWFDSDHCPFCPWRTSCDAAAHDTHDIALIPRLSRRQGSALRRLGIHRIDQVITLDPATMTTLPDHSSATEARLRRQAQALLTDQPLPVSAAIPSLPQVRLFLDIESDPQTREPWAFGLAGAPGDRFVIVVEPLVAGSDVRLNGIPVIGVHSAHEGWQRVLHAVRATGGALAHWGEAERLMLEQSADPHTYQELIPLMIDAQRELYKRVVLPTPRQSDQRGGGLKAAARWLGWRWSPGADHWTLAWEAYRQWRAQPSPANVFDRLTPAIVYLATDVEALAAVWRWLDAFVASINATSAPQDGHADRDTATNREC
ncbi:TM0106 family RecB-like putative nuclease [Roseiflexus castenholzii]|nr:TM0106 family RecB-like putative nuclease [Roseiflexus castenholzii]